MEFIFMLTEIDPPIPSPSHNSENAPELFLTQVFL